MQNVGLFIVPLIAIYKREWDTCPLLTQNLQTLVSRLPSYA